MRLSMLLTMLVLSAPGVRGVPAVVNGAMEGTPVDHSDGKGLLLTPPGWTPVNHNTARGDRLSVEPSDRPGAGQCLHVHTFGPDAGVYQTVAPLTKGGTYLVTAWVKRLSGTLNIEAYPFHWGPAAMRRPDGRSNGWTQLAVGLTAVDEGAHLYLVATPEADFLIDDVQIHPAPLQVGVPELLPYDFGDLWRYRVTLAASAGAPASPTVSVQAVAAEDAAGDVLAPPQSVRLDGAGPWTAIVGLPLAAERSFCLEVRDPASGAVLGGSSITLPPGSPWIVRYPSKNALFASLGYAWPLRVEVLTATPATMAGLRARALICDAADHAVREAVGRLDGNALVVPLEGQGLAPGDYRLRLSVRQADGSVVHEARRPLRLLPQAVSEVVVGPAGDTLVNGRRFFPIGLYWVLASPDGWKPGPARRTSDLTDLREAGFNTLHSYAFEHNDANDTDANAQAYLDMARDLGFMVMMGLRRDWCQGPEANFTAIEPRLRRLKDHPALLCWTLWDEPDANPANLPRVQAIYDLVDRLDPHHPAMPVFMSAGGRPFRAAADVNLFDCYPGAGNAGILPGVLNRARAALPDKPVWYVAQAYQQGSRFPSEADMRLYWQHALAADAKAIFWYSYGGDAKGWDSIRITPEHYASVKRAVRALADRVASGAAQP